MAYNNYKNYNAYPQQGYAPQQGYTPQGYAPQGYAPQGYAPRNGYNRNGGYQQQRQQVKKKSGAKEVVGTTKEGRQYFGINAWFFNRRSGLVTISAFESSKSTHFTTQRGRDGITLMFEVFYKDSGIKRLEVGMYFYDTGKAFLEGLGIIVSTKANNGGYAGYFRKKS